MKNKVIITTFSIIGLLFGLLGLALSLLPLGTIDLIPAIIGLLFGAVCYILTKESGQQRKLVYSVIIISVVAIFISLFTLLFMENKLAEDVKFEEKMEQSEKDATDDLEEALEDIDDLEDIE